MKLLLVEDDPDHADLTRRALSRSLEGIEIHWSEDGEEALSWLDQRMRDDALPDIVLLDLKMPRINGHRVLQRIKEDEHLRRLPVIVFTTSAADADRLAAQERYANSYVVKPMDYGGLKSFATDLAAFWERWHES